jgi:hypothetical protein
MSKNEAAFPVLDTNSVGTLCLRETGLTKRELIAAMAMQSLSTPHYSERRGRMEGLEPVATAEAAIEYADALLAELAKGSV